MHRRWFLIAIPLLAASPLLLPPAAAAGPSPESLVEAVQALPPDAASAGSGLRLQVEEVAVALLPDRRRGFLGIIAHAGELPEREAALVAGALGPAAIPELPPRVVSVRGLVCAAVPVPLRDLTDAGLRLAIDEAVRVARAAAARPDPFAPSGPAGLDQGRRAAGARPLLGSWIGAPPLP